MVFAKVGGLMNTILEMLFTLTAAGSAVVASMLVLRIIIRQCLSYKVALWN